MQHMQAGGGRGIRGPVVKGLDRFVCGTKHAQVSTTPPFARQKSSDRICPSDLLPAATTLGATPPCPSSNTPRQSPSIPGPQAAYLIAI